ncbi:hypothetical protein CFBP5877_06920 [Agrobacterium tumefaciens]|uniref:Uncharacterized protein n=1 Tax=Agrobacterium tumefaciens TaxID=358 RepID=A0AAE6B9H3_AGRTU|nr:hypothetical protein CFBP5499_07390 [Agrobacterium tumefaciens]QCL78833.1 hypothetical protein CFBP5877_06920 [Agrobacterium tumefaciens]
MFRGFQEVKVRVAYPPLPCRASPPQVGRSIRRKVSPISKLENEVTIAPLADLPPCGGDARQGRGG